MDEIKDEEFVELASEKGKIVSVLNHEIEEINQDRTQHSEEETYWYWLVRSERDNAIVIKIRRCLEKEKS